MSAFHGTGGFAYAAEPLAAGGGAVRSDGGESVTGTIGLDVLEGGPGADTVVGLAGDDRLIGDGGDDSLVGGWGSDTLIGGQGVDTMSGGAGTNVFSFTYGDTPVGPAITGGLGHIDHIVGWTNQDFIQVTGEPVATSANFQEITAPDLLTAFNMANTAVGKGVLYTAAQIGGDVVVFTFGYAFDVTVDLPGAKLSDISFRNVGPALGEGSPFLPAPPSGATGQVIGDMDSAHLSDLTGLTATTSASQYAAGDATTGLTLGGSGFTYDASAHLTGGSITQLVFDDPVAGGQALQMSLGFSTANPASAAPVAGWIQTDAATTAFTTLLAGDDTLSGGAGGTADVIHGYDGDDVVYGLGGQDSLFGGNGDDMIYANRPPDLPGASAASAADRTYLRGEDGNDVIVGGPGFDDINGNKGDDTIDGGSGGGDWLVGGQGNDVITAHQADIVWGNLGDDTLTGGTTYAQIRGGQGDDVIVGGSAGEFISGDRGNDTETGGGGADTFHGSQDAGVDRVLDFNQAEGDRVELDPGTTYQLIQVGNDLVISMGGQNQMILVGVQLSSLKDGWIFEG